MRSHRSEPLWEADLVVISEETVLGRGVMRDRRNACCNKAATRQDLKIQHNINDFEVGSFVLSFEAIPRG